MPTAASMDSIFTSSFSSYSEFIEHFHESIQPHMRGNKNAMLDALQQQLLESPNHLQSDNMLIRCVATYFPHEYQKTLLDYITTLKEGDKNLNQIMKSFSYSPPALNFCHLEATFYKLKEGMKVNLIKQIHVLLKRNPENINEFTNFISKNSAELSTLVNFLFVETLLHYEGQLRGSATLLDFVIFLLPKVENIDQLLSLCNLAAILVNSRETATKLIDHCAVHISQSILTTRRSSSEATTTAQHVKKRKKLIQKANIIEDACPPTLQTISSKITNNRIFYESLKEWIQFEDTFASVAFIVFCLLCCLSPKENIFILNVLCSKKSLSIPLLKAALSCLFNSEQNVSDIVSWATCCAHRENSLLAGVLFSYAFSISDIFIASDLISQLAAFITSDGSNGIWALEVFGKLCDTSANVMLRHKQSFLVVMDYLDHLNIKQIKEYYTNLVKLALIGVDKFGDPSLWDELMLIFKKQISSLVGKVRQCGMISVLTMLTVPTSSSFEENEEEEASCSQAPSRKKESPLHKKAFYELFEATLLSLPNDIESSIFLLVEMRELSMKIDSDIRRYLIKEINDFFEAKFVVELGKQRELSSKVSFNLEEDESLIAVDLSCQMSPIIPFIFSSMTTLSALENVNYLEDVDALLGCPVISPLNMNILRNWFASIVNCFYLAKDENSQVKCIKRLNEFLNFTDEDPLPVKEKEIVSVDGEYSHIISSANSLKLSKVFDSECTWKYPVIKLLPEIYVNYLNNSNALDTLSLLQCLISSGNNEWTVEQISHFLDQLLSLEKIKEGEASLLIEVFMAAVNQLYKLDSTVLSKQYCEKFIASTGNIDIKVLNESGLLKMIKVAQISGIKERINEYCERALDFIFSSKNSNSINEILNAVLELQGWNSELLNLLDDKIDLTNDDLVLSCGERVKLNIHEVLVKGLKNIKFDSMENVKRSLQAFQKCVQRGRLRVNDGYADVIIDFGRIYIDKFGKEALPLFASNLRTQQSLVLDCLKLLQHSTRSIQIICNHLKPEGKKKYNQSIPKMRKSLEVLLFLVKGMLEKSGCLAAFWMGNLKHRSIDGTEAASQIPIEYNEKSDSAIAKQQSSSDPDTENLDQ